VAAVLAMFERYKLIAAQRPKDHIVSNILNFLIGSDVLIHIDQDFDREVMENMKLVDATLDGTVTYEMTITPNFSNLNSMHSF
jgi:acyl-coenzyme A thioesterase 13